MLSSLAAVVASDSKVGKRGSRETRAQWTDSRTSFFVSILREFNSPRYRGQNGSVKEGWNAMTEHMNEKFTPTKFVVSQLKDREQRLKKDYNVVTLLLSKSGFGWDSNLKMATTIDEKWDELPKNLQRFKDKPFPYYDDFVQIYNGKVAGGKHCRRTSEKAYKSEFDLLEKADHIQYRTPSPTIPASNSAWTEFFPDELNLNTHSQYRTMAEEQANREAYTYSQSSVESQAERDAQAASDAQAARDAQPASDAQAARDASPKKNKRNNDTSMDELIALRREELEAYKDLIERQIQLKQRKIEKSDPNNDPFSMTKCMEKLKTFSFTKEERIEAIKFLKGDREAREIFIGCDEVDLADAYIRRSIAP